MKHQKIIEQLTLEEKASLTSGKDFWQTQDIERLNIPSIFLADGPCGIRKQAAAADHLGLNPSYPATCFPSSSTIANSWDENLAKKVGEALGEEAVDLKVNVILGPGVNIKRNPKCGRNFEYFSEDPYLAGKMGSSYVRGIQKNGISSCLKHFACNNQELRRMASDSIVDERALREIYLTPFEIVVKESGVKCVMTSYNKINGTYANENQHLYDILRKEWGYDGVVVTDWGGNNDRVCGFVAGNELEMPTTAGETDREIVEGVINKTILESTLDESVDRLLSLIFDTEKAFIGREKKSKHCVSTINQEKHAIIALQAGEESIVLLKNDNNVLPLGKEKIAIIGDFADNFRFQGAGSSIVNPIKISSPLDSLNECGFDFVGYEKGFDRFNKRKNRSKKALELGKKADKILYFMGLDEVTESEGVDRESIQIPKNQLQLLKQLKQLEIPIIVVLLCGSVVEMPFVDDVEGIVYCGLLGQEGGNAIINVLTGKVNPCGKLAETFPVLYEDVPFGDKFPSSNKRVEYRESIFVGYRYYDSKKVKVRFPFGYGLSYTTFYYSNIIVDKNGVSFDLTNTGDREGNEISQLYVGMCDSKIFRAEKELKGFTKTKLQPKETKRITIPFDDRSFRYFNTRTNRFEVEGGTYKVQVGGSIENLPLEDIIEVEGSEVKNPYNEEKNKHYYSKDIGEVTLEEFENILGEKIKQEKLDKRMTLGYNNIIGELKYAKGGFGRFAYFLLNTYYKYCKKVGKKSLANLMDMSIFNMPFRGVARLTGGGINYPMLDGLLLAVNGKFFKGITTFFKEKKILKKCNKKI